jgi:hypothetical protein
LRIAFEGVVVLNPGMEDELRKVLMRQLPVFATLEDDDLLLVSRKTPLMEGLIGPEVFAGADGPPGPPAAIPLSLTAPPVSEEPGFTVTNAGQITLNDSYLPDPVSVSENGKASYTGANVQNTTVWESSRWQIRNGIDEYYWSVDAVDFPWQVVNWMTNGFPPAPTVSHVTGTIPEQLGQLAIVRTTNASGSFKDVWTNSGTPPDLVTWQPPGHIFLDRTNGSYYRIFYSNGEADTELAYP